MNKELDFIKWHKLALITSIALSILSIAVVFVKGFNKSIDFTGGLLINIKTTIVSEESTLNHISHLRELIGDKISDDSVIQTIGNNGEIIIKVGNKNNVGQEQLIANVKTIILQEFNNNVEFRKIDFVGPQVSSELIIKSTLAVLCGCLAIMIYLAIRFKWQFGIGGLLSLIHDVILTVGFISITSLEFNLTTVAAILTLVGYSINDTVVIYDRIRHNLKKYKKITLGEIINKSTNQMLSRSITTSVVTFLAVLAIAILGGPTLRSFGITMLFGIAIGTYSSVFIASTSLLYLQKQKIN